MYSDNKTTSIRTEIMRTVLELNKKTKYIGIAITKELRKEKRQIVLNGKSFSDLNPVLNKYLSVVLRIRRIHEPITTSAK